MAAGKAIDPFWNIFSIHNSAETRELLEQYRIGDLDPNEPPPKQDLGELFSNEPTRDPSLKVLAERPFNAESPLYALHSFVTSNANFYVRHHLPVPKLDEKDFELVVEGTGIPADFKVTMKDLKQMPKYTVGVTLQCAGNRRKEMHNVKPVKGLQWENGAISNAMWSGVRLSDLLAKAGYPTPDLSKDQFPGDVEHVQFDGAEGYGASIPATKAFDPRGDVILAYEMNGETLPVDHGYPLRAIIPGHVAARSVKWLSKITLDSEESRSHWQQKDYKGFSPSDDLATSDYSKSTSIQELPVQSSIISPAPDGKLNIKDGIATVKGYAIAGGGRGIERVDVSIDGGNTWKNATLLKPNQPSDRSWAWTQWESKFEVKDKKEFELVCKAIDTSYNTQPESYEGIYNARGVLVSAWARIRAKVQ